MTQFSRGLTELFNQFTQEQMETLLRNGHASNSEKNHLPAAYLRIGKLGYRFLLTAIKPDNVEYAFALCDYDAELELGWVFLPKLLEMARQKNDVLFSKDDFVGQFNLGVYAKVASSFGILLLDGSECSSQYYFNKFSKGKNAIPSHSLFELSTNIRLQPFASSSFL